MYEGQCLFSRAFNLIDTAQLLCYNADMKWLIIPLVLNLQACAYTAVSTASFVVTGKSLTDHTVTAIVPNSNCNVTNPLKGQYYCEIDDPTVKYNRNGY